MDSNIHGGFRIGSGKPRTFPSPLKRVAKKFRQKKYKAHVRSQWEILREKVKNISRQQAASPRTSEVNSLLKEFKRLSKVLDLANPFKGLEIFDNSSSSDDDDSDFQQVIYSNSDHAF